ncbi:MAG: dihydrodipicolinate synthase family protein [Proteiniphilum sp.]|nr:dihydrodipicolinate synthase family protein [Proteiniphilum sp.]
MENKERLNGLVAATFTPMRSDGSIDCPAIVPYAQHIAEHGIEGVFVCGTTGEFASLTINERKTILEHWVKAADGRFKVIAHVGSNSQQEAALLASHAANVGAWGIASIAPSFFKPATVGELVAFFKPVAAAAPTLPFYYYNMPAMTGVDLSVPRFLEEGRKVMPNLVGVKYTHNNMMEMAECIHLNNRAFEVLHGYDETLLCGLSLGVVAGVGSTYNYLSPVYHGIMEAVRENELEKAQQLQMRSIEVVKIIIRYGGGVRGGKAIMNLIGIECGGCRLPLSPFTHQETDALKHDLEQIGFVIKQ